MIAVYIADRQLYHVLPTAINSLLHNNPHVEAVYLLIEDDFVEFLEHPKVRFLNLANYDVPRKNEVYLSTYPYTSISRLFLESILDEDKIIYLDVDTLVNGKLRELWNLDLEGCYVAAREESKDYYNSGVLVMNLQYMREQNSAKLLKDLLRSHRFEFPDQDVMNIAFKNHIKSLPKKFNVFEDHKDIHQQEIVVRHFAGPYKPWTTSISDQDSAMWQKYYCESLNI